MFYGSFEENGKREIELKDIKHKVNQDLKIKHFKRKTELLGFRAVAERHPHFATRNKWFNIF